MQKNAVPQFLCGAAFPILIIKNGRELNMNEVKTPKKPLIYYYGIVMLALMLFNFLAIPWFAQRQILEVDYGTFMDMAERREIGRVEVQDNQILFANREGTQIYKTGLMVDPDLIYRLKNSGAIFPVRS